MKGEESLMFLCWICLNLKLAYNLYKFGHLPVDIPKTQFHSINELYLSWEKECGRALRFIEFRKCKCSNKISRRVPNSCCRKKTLEISRNSMDMNPLQLPARIPVTATATEREMISDDADQVTRT